MESDLEALTALCAATSGMSMQKGQRGEQGWPEGYHLTFHGPSFRLEGPIVSGRVKPLLSYGHQVHVKLGPNYPRQAPLILWMSPIFHPNIAPGGTVCLGGYSSHWVPSLTLDRLCEMLWNILVYRNYNLQSPYHRQAAEWLASQSEYDLPLESRSLREMRGG